MADWYGSSVLSKSRDGKKKKSSLGDEDLQEEEVWGGGVKEEREDDSKGSNLEFQGMSRRIPAAPRVIPRANNGGAAYEAKVAHQSSAPLNIPDWSKTYINGVDHGYDDDDDDDDDDGMVPPHEYIARRVARSQIASFSMCEGVGRTLKGRDLSKLRNAILTKTGFLE